MLKKKSIWGLECSKGNKTEVAKFQEKYKVSSENALILFYARDCHNLSSGILLASLLENASENFMQSIVSQVTINKNMVYNYASVYTIACQFVYMLLNAKNAQYGKGIYLALLSKLKLDLNIAHKEICKIEKSITSYSKKLKWNSNLHAPCLETLNDLSILVDLENLMLYKGNKVFDYVLQQRSPKAIKSLSKSLESSTNFVVTQSNKYKSFDIVSIATAAQVERVLSKAFIFKVTDKLEEFAESSRFKLEDEKCVFNNVLVIKKATSANSLTRLQFANRLGFCGYIYSNGSVMRYGKCFDISNNYNKKNFIEDVNAFLIGYNTAKINGINCLLQSIDLEPFEIEEQSASHGILGVIDLLNQEQVTTLEKNVLSIVKLYQTLH